MMWLAILAAAVGGVVLVASRRPDSFRVERAASIAAPPAKIFALLEDFRAWPSWSPWEKLDPHMQRTHSGAASGVGAAYAWSGNSKAGAGRMEIMGAAPPSRLTIRLDFLRPFKTTNTCEFVLTPKEGGTHVSWAMSGPSPLMSKLFGLFVNMDQMIGRDFEAGLANMKRVTEG
jgi:uncharacterized protein YndB with AHSA1/START domain